MYSRQRIIKAIICRTVALASLFAFPAHAEEPRQYKIEAAFLYNFFSYITWPELATPDALTAPIICIFGEDPVRPYLEYIQYKMANERQLTIRTVTEEDELGSCHLLFSRKSLPETWRREARFMNTLTVSNSPTHLEQGGMIELHQEGSRIAMEINYSLLDKYGFQVSSRLLHLAQRVE